MGDVWPKLRKTPAHVRELRRAQRARNFPTNTCPASRHVQMMAESLVKRKKVDLQELWDDDHIASSMASVVASLWQARTKIARLEARLGKRKP